MQACLFSSGGSDAKVRSSRGHKVSAYAWPLLVALSIGGGMPLARASEPDTVAARAEAVDKCFAEKLKQYAAAHPAMEIRYTGLTSMYVAEQVVRDAKFDEKTRKIEGPLMQMSVAAYCDDVLFKPYINKVQAALAERAKTTSGGLAPFGTDDIEADSLFVQGYQELIGKHYKGHSDITRSALLRMGGPMSLDAVTLIARASQTPDLYRWSDGRYHAHTPEFPPRDPDERRRNISVGMKSFEKLTCDLSSTFVELTKLGATEDSLFLLGVLAHAVQDLEYHRGMTMSQHSGLSYVAALNPDSPDIPKAKEIENRAIDNTMWVMQLLRGKVGDSTWSALMRWRPLGDFSFRSLASRVYGLKGAPNSQDMNVAALASYWSLSLAYRSGGRPRSELEVDSCDKEDGISCWNTAEVRRYIEAKLGAGEACQ